MIRASLTKYIAVALALAALQGFSTTAVKSQTSITWVSASGSGVAPCDSPATACQGIIYALQNTSDGGIIRCAGPVFYIQSFTITQSVTIECSLGAGGINGQTITINAPGKRVVLQNLSVHALGFPSLPAIQITAADSVSLENVFVRGSSGSGLRDNRTGPGKLVIRNSTFQGNGGAGIVIAPAGGLIGASLDNVSSNNNSYGLAVGAGGHIMVKRSVFSWNANAGIEGDPVSFVGINDTLVSFNGIGLQNFGAMQVSNSDISSNSTAVSGPVQSYGNNRIFANSTDGTPLGSVGGLSSENGQR